MITNGCIDWFMKNAHLIQVITPNILREKIVYRATVALERNEIVDPFLNI